MEIKEDTNRDGTLRQIKDLCLQQIQLDKGMPILQLLDTDLEELIVGKDE